MALSESHVVMLEDPKLGCTVLDHIILTEESYFSFADEGMI
jgi:DNA repair protein RadC